MPSQLPIKRAWSGLDKADPESAIIDPSENPHIPRKKRTPTEILRPLEVLAAANAAAAARLACDGQGDESGAHYMLAHNLSHLAAVAAAESESDADLARSPESSGGSQVKHQSEAQPLAHQARHSSNAAVPGQLSLSCLSCPSLFLSCPSLFLSFPCLLSAVHSWPVLPSI